MPARPQHLGQVYGDTASLLALVLDGGAASGWRAVRRDYDSVLSAIDGKEAAPFAVAEEDGWLMALGNSILEVFKRQDDEVVLVGKIPDDDEDDARESDFVQNAALGATGPVRELGAVSVPSGVVAIFSAPNDGPDRRLLWRARASLRRALRFDGGLAFALPPGAYTLFQERVRAPFEQRFWLVPRGRAVAAAPARATRGKVQAGAEGPEARVLSWPGGKATVTHSVAFSPDGTLLAAGGHFEASVCVWRVADGEPVYTANRLLRHKHPRAGVSGVDVCFSTANELIARCDGEFSGWRTADFQPIDFDALNAKLPESTYARDATFCISPSDGRLALTEDHDPYVTDPARRKLSKLDGGSMLSCLAFTPDGKLLVGAGREVVTWDVQRRKLVVTSKLPGGDECSDLALWPDGKRLIVTLNHRLAIYGLKARRHTTIVKDVPTRRRYHLTTSVALDPAGRWRATARDDDRSIYLWDARSNKLARTLRGHLPSHVTSNSFHWLRFAFAPGGSWLAVNAGLRGKGGAVTLHPVTR